MADIDATAQQNRDGSMLIRVEVPPTPEWATYIDSAFQRMNTFCTATNRWHFVNLTVPSYSFGYICTLEKSAPTQSMSGGSWLQAVAVGFGATVVGAIDMALDNAAKYEQGAAEGETP